MQRPSSGARSKTRIGSRTAAGTCAPKLSENALRNLAVVSAAAQRISRLALGASTENVHRNPYARMTEAESRDDLLHKIADGEHAFDGFTFHHRQI